MSFTNQPFSLVRSFAIVAIILVVVMGSDAPGAAQAPSLAGTWRVTQSAGGQNFFLLMDFSTGGASHYTDQENKSGVGVWTKNSGGNYSATFEEFEDCFSTIPGNDCRFRFRATIQLSGASNLTATLTADQLSLDGSTVVGFLGNGTLAGTRLAVVPE